MNLIHKKFNISYYLGKKNINLILSQESFAWITDVTKFEKKMIKSMKKGSRIMVTGIQPKRITNY